MNQREQIRREYRGLLKSLSKLTAESPTFPRPIQDVLRTLRTGWLTPGSEILRRLDNNRLSLRSVAQRPVLLQRKWFMELLPVEKARWVGLFWDSHVRNELPEILGLSKRRLLQLMKVGN